MKKLGQTETSYDTEFLGRNGVNPEIAVVGERCSSNIQLSPYPPHTPPPILPTGKLQTKFEDMVKYPEIDEP